MHILNEGADSVQKGSCLSNDFMYNVTKNRIQKSYYQYTYPEQANFVNLSAKNMNPGMFRSLNAPVKKQWFCLIAIKCQLLSEQCQRLP